MTQYLLRFVIGGLVVSAFAVIGDLFKPKSFGGLFGAAPSVALATLGLTILKNGSAYASIEARSMVAGAIAMLVYAQFVCWMLLRHRAMALRATLVCMPAWIAVALGSWYFLLR